ncbi:cupin domain-containing protein [Kitasatospora sp. NPDC048239]|uniref:cupin domain-containing protein n=1 Tax=Kitasatospora sp. NPDC048239 TaxID=3364046 RepID=UPI003719F4E0
MPVVQTITLSPGADTGWHYHPGRVDVVVLSGTLTRTLHDGRVEVSRAGDSLVEEAGPVHVHIGRNLGAEPVVLIASYDSPAGCPLAVPVAEPAWSRAAGAPVAATTEPSGRPRDAVRRPAATAGAPPATSYADGGPPGRPA